MSRDASRLAPPKGNYVREIVQLTVAKVELLKLKSDKYTIQAILSDEDRDNINDALLEVNDLLKELKYE